VNHINCEENKPTTQGKYVLDLDKSLCKEPEVLLLGVTVKHIYSELSNYIDRLLESPNQKKNT